VRIRSWCSRQARSSSAVRIGAAGAQRPIPPVVRQAVQVRDGSVHQSG
jgi:hypothetical protein